MIVIDANTPRWIRELDRYRHFKNLIFLHGNVLDLVDYTDARDGRNDWIPGDSIDGFLERYLSECGYTRVEVLDPIGEAELAGQSPAAQPAVGTTAPPVRSTAAGQSPRPPATDRQSPATNNPRRPDANVMAAAIAGIATAMGDVRTPCAFIINLASRMITTPGRPSEREHALLARLFRASLRGVTAWGPSAKLNNLIILICDKLNDFPPFLYMGNPRARSILVDKPDRAGRERFFTNNYAQFHGSQPDVQPPDGLAARFGFLTDGLANYELQSLLTLSLNERIPIEPPEALVSRYKFGITTSEWDSPALRKRLSEAEVMVRRRVKGQNTAVERVTDLVKRAWLGLTAGEAGRSHRPRGVLFFAGPTGVGKTEMAKALAELLFDSEERMIRFDMSEYAAEHADQRLLGSPPGYVGYEEGGQLTNQVKDNPFSVLLFDEIEKAHPRIFDKFLQILDDGRLTDGKGDTVYFSECVIIFTSNLGSGALGEVDPKSAVTPDDHGRSYAKVRGTILAEIRRHFNEQLRRPEILNRFGDNFVVFDFIRPPLHQQIVDQMIGNLCAAIRKVHGIRLSLAPPVRRQIEQLAEAQLEHGGRGIRNLIDRALVDPLARWLFDHGATDPGAAIAELEITGLTDHGENEACRFSLKGEARSKTPEAEPS